MSGHKQEITKFITGIIDNLGGAIDSWNFKGFLFDAIFYRYISENVAKYVLEKDTSNE